MRRIKLNDRVAFPTSIDLNSFIDHDDPRAQEAYDRLRQNREQKLQRQASQPDTSADESAAAAAASAAVSSSSSSAPASAATAESAGPAARGPYIYDLFSIMIQSGSALGGHYYAYIK